jgi:hypothetical protein
MLIMRLIGTVSLINTTVTNHTKTLKTTNQDKGSLLTRREEYEEAKCRHSQFLLIRLLSQDLLPELHPRVLITEVLIHFLWAQKDRCPWENATESAIRIGHRPSVPETCPYMANRVHGFLGQKLNFERMTKGWERHQNLISPSCSVSHLVDGTKFT